MDVATYSNLNETLVKLLVKKYNPLDYSEKLTELLTLVYPDLNFQDWQKSRLHELVNNVVIKKHNGELVLKYYLFQHFYKKNVTAAFEIKVNNSRVDFLTINGTSKSFEIKSGLDNLSKLKKQSADYLLVFDYNYLVVDEKHLENALEMVPQCFGIWTFSKGAKRIIHRNALLNIKIDPEAQLRLLTKRELYQQFKEKKDISNILRDFNINEINYHFKSALKKRYQRRWDFIIEHRKSILPIDLQFFFNRNIEPAIIYYS
jgi:hypothetical protein